MTTIATLLSGGEGVGVGACAVGLRHLWGIEADARIAGVAQANGFNIIIAKIQDVDPATLEVPDVLHASPECQRASQARQADEGGRESLLDIEIGASVCRYLEVLRPRIFTLENVWGYRNFTAFRGICATLNTLGYFYHYANVNAADFGVPQTRRRLILRAVRGGLLPELPAPERWVGWYEAIEDLLPELPESQFAPWQLARLPDTLQDSEIFSNQESDNHKGGTYGVPHRRSTEPALTITGMSSGWHKAFIVDQLNASNNDGAGTQRKDDEPVFTLTAYSGRHPAPKAFIINSVNAGQEYSDGLRYEESPAMTITKEAQPRAFIVSDQSGNAGEGAQIRMADEPATTMRAGRNGGALPRIWLSQGRVVKMTPRCLARFQSFPDSYVLSSNMSLACRVIGNAVPPLLYQKIISQLVGVIHA